MKGNLFDSDSNLVSILGKYILLKDNTANLISVKGNLFDRDPNLVSILGKYILLKGNLFDIRARSIFKLGLDIGKITNHLCN